MKKFLSVLLAAAVFFCGAAFLKTGMEVSAKDSPTAPTVTDPTSRPVSPTYVPGTSGALPTTPGVIPSSPSGITAPSAMSPSVTRPGSSLTSPGATTPDGSTATATVSDTSPSSPETGSGTSGIFAFAGVVVLAATAAVLSGKKDDSVEE